MRLCAWNPHFSCAHNSKCNMLNDVRDAADMTLLIKSGLPFVGFIWWILNASNQMRCAVHAVKVVCRLCVNQKFGKRTWTTALCVEILGTCIVYNELLYTFCQWFDLITWSLVIWPLAYDRIRDSRADVNDAACIYSMVFGSFLSNNNNEVWVSRKADQ